MTSLLTNNLPLLAGAPSGIKKLRELVLELAVRGKLVPQEANDEPASGLLKRIAAERSHLVAEGRIKRQKAWVEIGEEKKPFELPEGWEWACLSDLVNVLNGRAYKKEELLDSGTPILRVGNLFTSKHWYYSDLVLEENKYCNPGDLLFAWSASFGPFIWCGERAIYHYHIWKLDLHAEGCLSKQYLYNCLLEQTQEIKAAGHGVSMVHMTKEKMEKLVVPVPPLAEQHRIVAKVDELMALCDRLEAKQSDIEAAHEHLVQALLDSLTRAVDAADFVVSWRRLSDRFHTLFTTESSVDALKQTVLRLAVMGKLVPQNSSDEPVGCLLLKSGIESQSHWLQGWAKVPLGHLGEILGGSTPSKADGRFWDGDIPWVSPKDMKRPVIHDSEDHVSIRALKETSLRAVPENSLLMVVRGMILAHSFPVAITARTVTINQDMKALVPPREISSYLLIYLQAVKQVMVELVDRSTHGTCKLISAKLWSHTVCLPPLAEQHRIIAKVDQLMLLCEHLKSGIAAAKVLNEQLAATVVAEAIAEKPIAIVPNVIHLSGYLVSKLATRPTFGRTAHMKWLFLADQHLGLKLGMTYERQAAGPLDKLIYQVEEQAAQSQLYATQKETLKSGIEKIVYRPAAAIDRAAEAGAAELGDKRAELDRLIGLLGGHKTEDLEIVATLYAVWNDALAEGQQPDDGWLINEFRTNWHKGKERFSPELLAKWLSWMREHRLVPVGKISSTRHQGSLLH